MRVALRRARLRASNQAWACSARPTLTTIIGPDFAIAIAGEHSPIGLPSVDPIASFTLLEAAAHMIPAQ